MHIRIIYGTNSGSTRSAAEIMSQQLEKEGHRVTVQSAHETQPDELSNADLTIIGSCSWDRFEGKERLQGQLQQHWHELQQAIGSKKYSGQTFAVFGVGDSTYTHFCGAADLLEALVKKWKGVQVGQTLRLDSYYFDLELNEQRIHDWLRSLRDYLQ
jgi:flavodoxin I